MNAERLLRDYERIADAPDAIARLRRFILDLAVRGKLVPQDPNDEPASELLKRIVAEKARLVKVGEIGKQEPVKRIPDADIIFRVPKTWEWVPATFPAYVLSDMGKKVQTKDVLESGDFPVVDQGKVFIRGYCNDPTRVVRLKAPLILFGDHTRETKLIDFDFVVGADGVKLLQPLCLFTRYYYRALQWLPLDSRGYGRHFKLLRASSIPLPPLAEQHRIVAKVDELMSLCDRLEAARAHREVARNKLAAASLARLSAPDPDAITFAGHAGFAFDKFAALTTRPDQIKGLRQTILNLAVRGKLVRQDPRDEPASELLTRISKEKARLVKAGELKRDKEFWEGLPSVPPYVLPTNWRWARIQDVFEISRGGSPRPAGDPRFFGGPTPWITVQEITKDNDKYLAKTETGLTDEGVQRSRLINPGDLLLTNSGATLGVPKISKIRACMNDGVAVLRQFHSISLNDFSYLYLHSQTSSFRTINQGMGQPNLNTPIIAGWFIPLPPLAEQQRIVAKVDELLALCDQLEASLTTADDIRRRLLEALLAEALAPDDERELEAAE
jgi:type I restriction enzyme, S subunit